MIAFARILSAITADLWRAAAVALALVALALGGALAISRLQLGRTQVARDRALSRVQQLEATVRSYEVLKHQQEAAAKAAGERSDAIGRETATVVDRIHRLPKPRTAEELQQWALEAGRLIVASREAR